MGGEAVDESERFLLKGEWGEAVVVVISVLLI